MQIIDGKKIAAEIREQIAAEVEKLVADGRRRPNLVGLLVGHDGGSESYMASKTKACEQCGFQSSLIRMAQDVTQDELMAQIRALNEDDSVDGFIVQMPLPRHIDEQAVTQSGS